MLRPRLIDQADFCSRSAHIEGQDLIEFVLARDAACEDRTACRSRFDQADRKADRRLSRRDPAARCHQQQGTGETGSLELVFECDKIPPDQRLEVGVGAGSREAFVFAHFR